MKDTNGTPAGDEHSEYGEPVELGRLGEGAARGSAAPLAGWAARATLPAQRQVPRAARRIVTTLLLAWGVDEDVELAELVVTELVTNAVRHGDQGQGIELELDLRGDVLTLAVVDGSREPPVLRGRVPGVGGLGLQLIQRICRDWGTQECRAGKRVWAELSTHAHPLDLAG